MAYPGPPGVPSNTPSHSLPPRPPQSSHKPPGFKPGFKPIGPSYPASSASYPASSAPAYPTAATSSYPSAPGYGAPGYDRGYGAAPPTTSYAPNPSIPIVGGPPGAYSQPAPYGYPQQSYQQQGYQQPGYQQPTYYGAGNGSTNFSAPPQIHNPFPAPNANPTPHVAGGYDPEAAQQMAQWQSAYMPRDPSADVATKGPVAANAPGARYGAATFPAPQAAAVATTEATDANAGAAPGEKKKTVYRQGGGKKWQDDTLLDWDPTHQRLFVGNLAGETTDESLLKAFSRWPSVAKAKVIRDKVTTKSKGYGFVAFSNIDDFFQAAKEMNGKYIQSHPVTIRKASTEIRPQNIKEDKKGGKWNRNKNKKDGNHNKNGGGNKSGSGSGSNNTAAGGYEPHLGPAGGGGVTKPGQKTRGGLKLLG